MSRNDLSIEELKSMVVSLLHDKRGHSQADMFTLRARWHMGEFAKYIEASEADIQRALDELCEEGVLDRFPEVGGVECYVLCQQAAR